MLPLLGNGSRAILAIGVAGSAAGLVSLLGPFSEVWGSVDCAGGDREMPSRQLAAASIALPPSCTRRLASTSCG